MFVNYPNFAGSFAGKQFYELLVCCITLQDDLLHNYTLMGMSIRAYIKVNTWSPWVLIPHER